MQPESIAALPEPKELISVRKAIFYGLLFINVPVVLLFVGTLGIAIFLFRTYESSFILLAGLVVAFVSAWMWWSFATPRWRIWAMLRVDNLYLLHASAVSAQLTWPRDHLFEHTETRTQLQALQQQHIETRDLLNRFRYYVDYQAAIDPSNAAQFYRLRQSLACFCRAAYSGNKRRADVGNLKYLLDQLRYDLKSARLTTNTAEWEELIDLLVEQIDLYQDSIKSQLLQ